MDGVEVVAVTGQFEADAAAEQRDVPQDAVHNSEQLNERRAVGGTAGRFSNEPKILERRVQESAIDDLPWRLRWRWRIAKHGARGGEPEHQVCEAIAHRVFT